MFVGESSNSLHKYETRELNSTACHSEKHTLNRDRDTDGQKIYRGRSTQHEDVEEM